MIFRPELYNQRWCYFKTIVSISTEKWSWWLLGGVSWSRWLAVLQCKITFAQSLSWSHFTIKDFLKTTKQQFVYSCRNLVIMLKSTSIKYLLCVNFLFYSLSTWWERDLDQVTKTSGHKCCEWKYPWHKKTCHRINCVNWRWGSGVKREKLKFQLELLLSGIFTELINTQFMSYS